MLKNLKYKVDGDKKNNDFSFCFYRLMPHYNACSLPLLDHRVIESLSDRVNNTV